MDKLTLNLELSKELHELEQGFYPVKQCYMNVFNNFLKVARHFNSDDFRVMFCYYNVYYENLYTRHACFYKDGQAIDPTMITLYGENIGKQFKNYIPFKLLTPDEYFALVSKEYKADLPRSLKKYELDIAPKLNEKGLVLIG